MFGAGAAGGVAVVALLCVALQPLTEIAPTPDELAVFPATVLGAVSRLEGRLSTQIRRVHVVGASEVEAMVDWRPACEAGLTVLLIGPQAKSPPDAPSCISAHSKLYSKAALVQAGVPEPDAVVALNADMYTCTWRRTLAELLQRQVPVVMTTYCEFEGAQMERLLKWHEMEFTASKFTQCDQELHLGAAHVAAEVGRLKLPLADPRLLWQFEPNPHAHSEPRECYSLRQHGVRNAYWLGFVGEEPELPPSASAEL